MRYKTISRAFRLERVENNIEGDIAKSILIAIISSIVIKLFKIIN